MRSFALCFFALLLTGFSSFAATKPYYLYFDSSLRASTTNGIAGVRVIDLREDTSMIGQFTDGMYTKFKMVTEHALAKDIQDFGRSLFQGKPSTDSLLVVVHHHACQYTDVIGFHLEADLFRGSSNQYKYLFTADDFFASYIDDRNIQRNYNEYWQKTFERAVSTSLDSLTENQTYDEAAAVGRTAAFRNTLPVYNTTEYQYGIYRTFEEFLQNKPSITQFFQVDNMTDRGNQPDFYLSNEKGKRGERISQGEYYAVYNGKRWFKSTTNGASGMKVEKGNFIFQTLATGLSDYKVDAIGASYGALGAMAIQAARRMEEKKTGKKIEDKKVLFFYAKIDPRTGRPLLYSQKPLAP